MSSFYKDRDLKYPEIGVLLEDSVMEMDKDTKEWKRKKAKIMIPILMPDMYSENAVEKDIYHDNIRVKGTNYIELTIPKYLYPNPKFKKKVPVLYKENTEEKEKVVYEYETKVTLKKGTKLIVAFIGGSFSIEDIKIIGLVDDEAEEGDKS